MESKWKRDGGSIPACVGAGVIIAAVSDTLGAPFCADVVWEGLRVLGDVGRDIVVAYAAVGQSVLSMLVRNGHMLYGNGMYRIAVVGHGGHGSDTGLLEADERALSLLVLAPCIWVEVSGMMPLK